MYTRLLGADADVSFTDELLGAVRRLEDRFPAPDFAVVFADSDADDPDDVDQIIVCRRWGGVLMPAAYIGTDELAEYERDGVDWVAQTAADLARTDAEIEEIIAAEETGASE